MPADVMVLDLDGLDRDALMPVAAKDLLFARATAVHVVDIWAQGRQVMREGEVLGVDLARLETELRAAYRSGLSSKAELLSLWPQLEHAIGDHYCGCC